MRPAGEEVARAKNLWQQDVGSKQTWDKSERDLDSARRFTREVDAAAGNRQYNRYWRDSRLLTKVVERQLAYNVVTKEFRVSSVKGEARPA